MHSNVLDDAREFVEIRWRIDIRSPTAPDSVIHFRAGGVNGRNHLVGGAEVVAAGLFRVGAPIGEDDAGIARLHDASALRVVRNQPGRSEERRVGKECRSRWARGAYKRK